MKMTSEILLDSWSAEIKLILFNDPPLIKYKIIYVYCNCNTWVGFRECMNNIQMTEFQLWVALILSMCLLLMFTVSDQSTVIIY